MVCVCARVHVCVCLCACTRVCPVCEIKGDQFKDASFVLVAFSMLSTNINYDPVVSYCAADRCC